MPSLAEIRQYRLAQWARSPHIKNEKLDDDPDYTIDDIDDREWRYECSILHCRSLNDLRMTPSGIFCEAHYLNWEHEDSDGTKLPYRVCSHPGCFEPVVTKTHPNVVGYHWGRSGSLVLYDPTKNWEENCLVGRILKNKADRSQGTVVSNTKNRVFAVMVGGFRNRWGFRHYPSRKTTVRDDYEIIKLNRCRLHAVPPLSDEVVRNMAEVLVRLNRENQEIFGGPFTTNRTYNYTHIPV